MSISKFLGGLITKNPPTPSGPYQNSTAPGIWTLTQVANYIKQGLWPTAGNTNPDVYIENLFSTYLYTGNGTSQTITNGIDLSTKGGLVWIKQRSAARNNLLFDTVRGATKPLYSNLNSAEGSDAQSLTAFNSTGFSIGSDSGCNINAGTYVAWTFREQAKFFDVVTYTGNGVGGRTISHSLGSVPGCIIVKKTSSLDDWFVYHRANGATPQNNYLVLNATNASAALSGAWFNTAPTSTQFTVGNNSAVNSNGETYVAYLFAHDAGGFGLSGTDNVISCGSFTHTTGSTQSINLGYEPQWALLKRSSGADNWFLMDTMRGWTVSNTVNLLNPNLSGAESGSSDYLIPTATGFDVRPGLGPDGVTYIYIAIRRGPMKTPTSGTSVFAPVTQSANTTTVTTNFPVDLSISAARNGADLTTVIDRLRGGGSTTNSYWLYTASTSNEGNAVGTAGIGMDNMTSLQNNYWGSVYRANSGNIAYWSFRRAPGFFDEVCYTGNGTAGRTVTHNLAVVPEMMIVKARDYVGGRPWPVYHSGMGNTKFMYLNTTDAEATNTWWNNTTPTSTVFTVGSNSVVNFSGTTYVAYLFASCPGVSKVGSYTGTGTTLQVNCGFTSGARFVMIKRTDSTGDWYVWDSARGIVAGNDPYLLMNSTAAEVTNTDYVDTYSAGFEISSTAPAAINANGGSFIFLAIA